MRFFAAEHRKRYRLKPLDDLAEHLSTLSQPPARPENSAWSPQE